MNSKGRGYADHWGSAFGKELVEAEVGRQLRDFLVKQGRAIEGTVQNRPPPYPDVVLKDQLDGEWGIEVTEIVDSSAARIGRKVHRGALPESERVYRAWTPEELSEKLKERVARKDGKLANPPTELSKMILAIHTDELTIDVSMVRETLSKIELPLVTESIDMVFFVMSYSPRSDLSIFPNGYPVFEIPVVRSG